MAQETKFRSWIPRAENFFCTQCSNSTAALHPEHNGRRFFQNLGEYHKESSYNVNRYHHNHCTDNSKYHKVTLTLKVPGRLEDRHSMTLRVSVVDSSWNVMAHGDAREGKWRGNPRMEWVASTLHTTSEHGVSSITTADAHTSAASSRLNWRPRWFKWTRPFRRKTESGFCACAITFQLASTCLTFLPSRARDIPPRMSQYSYPMVLPLVKNNNHHYVTPSPYEQRPPLTCIQVPTGF